MSGKIVAVAQLSFALLAAIGCVWSWRAAAIPARIEPVTGGEPAKASMNYDPSLISLSLILATVAGVLLVLGVGRWRRSH